MIVARTDTAEATMAVAAQLASLSRPGDLVLLAGDLGAGKTVFVKGFARACGVTAPVTSPTFTLAQHYPGRPDINHLDVYRLEALEEAADLALPELLDGTAVTLIEWGDAITGVLRTDYLEVRLRFGEGDDDRTIEIRTVGSGWSARSRAIASALEEWADPC